mmetsp:Transcript_17451/g.67743  ORF Transcript_17451/g.67743 Transcript_17451/m.67743 type:complete len:220 (+) Transcript_17451:67-726(+)
MCSNVVVPPSVALSPFHSRKIFEGHPISSPWCMTAEPVALPSAACTAANAAAALPVAASSGMPTRGAKKRTRWCSPSIAQTYVAPALCWRSTSSAGFAADTSSGLAISMTQYSSGIRAHQTLTGRGMPAAAAISLPLSSILSTSVMSGTFTLATPSTRPKRIDPTLHTISVCVDPRRSFRYQAAPTRGWPAKGISDTGVKIRTLGGLFLSFSSMKIVSA